MVGVKGDTMRMLRATGWTLRAILMDVKGYIDADGKGCYVTWMAFSSARRCSPLSDSLTTLRLLARSMFLTHLFACPCGSIISGHRRAFATMMPLSMENESFGSPAMSHSRT
eukprot:1732102-Pyramimonas_sp.AAC.1